MSNRTSKHSRAFRRLRPCRQAAAGVGEHDGRVRIAEAELAQYLGTFRPPRRRT